MDAVRRSDRLRLLDHVETDELDIESGDASETISIVTRPTSETVCRIMDNDIGSRFGESMRVLIVAGIPAGVVLVGVGSRVAMLVLRLTSPDHVRGVTSDDGFIIGRVTLGGTYNLLALGGAVGIIGAGAYRMVSPWLIGPIWFRHVTTGLAAGAVVGSMLVHSNGIDFTLLQPTWLAIGLFVALPALFGTLVGVAVDSVSRPDSWTNRGRRRWVLPVLAVGCFPATLPIALVAALIVGILLVLGDREPLQRVRNSPIYALAARTVWLLVAVSGLIALVNDTRALT